MRGSPDEQVEKHRSIPKSLACLTMPSKSARPSSAGQSNVGATDRLMEPDPAGTFVEGSLTGDRSLARAGPAVSGADLALAGVFAGPSSDVRSQFPGPSPPSRPLPARTGIGAASAPPTT